MAPRASSRSERNLQTNALPRSRARKFLADALSIDSDGSYLEVPFYLIAPGASSKRELMKKASILKSGSYGCGAGFSGTITYPLTEKENELLNSMSAQQAAPAVPQQNEVAADAVAPHQAAPGGLPQLNEADAVPQVEMN